MDREMFVQEHIKFFEKRLDDNNRFSQKVLYLTMLYHENEIYTSTA